MFGHVERDILHGFQSMKPLYVKMGQTPVNWSVVRVVHTIISDDDQRNWVIMIFYIFLNLLLLKWFTFFDQWFLHTSLSLPALIISLRVLSFCPPQSPLFARSSHAFLVQDTHPRFLLVSLSVFDIYIIPSAVFNYLVEIWMFYLCCLQFCLITIISCIWSVRNEF